MRYKYAHNAKGPAPDGKGRPSCPDRWITGPDPIRRDKYYAWLKHKAQARFRNEDYELTWSEWESIWSEAAWNNRGRTSSSTCLQRIDRDLGWCVDNCELVSRHQHLSSKRRDELDNG